VNGARPGIRAFRPEDAPALVKLSIACARGETDFVMNPFWETEDELFAEFERFGIDPCEHLLVSESDDAEPSGLVGFVRQPGAPTAGFYCPIVTRSERRRGLGGELLRAAQELGRNRLGILLATAAIGTRNRAGYSLLSSHGFRPVRQHFLLRCDAAPAEGAELPTETILEPATPEDAEAILDVYHACGFEARSREEMRSAMSDGRHEHAVARNAGRVVAFTELDTHWPRRVWVAFVGVMPEQRDRGLGSALVAWALRLRFESGTVSAWLLLSLANRTALRAYEKVGFRRHRVIDVLEKYL